MYISTLKLWNFRKFGYQDTIDIAAPNLKVDFNKGINLIVGENDSGKTAILDAIKIALSIDSADSAWYLVEAIKHVST